MENKKYQVFLSSTYLDLRDERSKILDLLLMADCIPAGMEAFVATDLEQFEVIKKVIDLCDYYVLIIGMKYGSVNPLTGISYTEMEYDYAIKKGIPVLVFAIDENAELPSDKRDSDRDKIEKLSAFRRKALSNRMASIWISVEDLIGKAAVSIMHVKTEIPRPGWQRATDYDEADLRRQIMELTDKNNRLQQELSEARETISAFTSTSDLAFDDCTYDITYHYYLGSAGNYQERTGKSSLSLTKVFERIATEMMDVMISEHTIKDVLVKMINRKESIYFDDSQIIKRILNQLRHLGLMQSKYSSDNNTLFWGLTDKGRKTRDEMILIKNKS